MPTNKNGATPEQGAPSKTFRSAIIAEHADQVDIPHTFQIFDIFGPEHAA